MPFVLLMTGAGCSLRWAGLLHRSAFKLPAVLFEHAAHAL